MSDHDLIYVELDCPKCDNLYGVAPCTASGDEKCKNTPATCQDLPNYLEGDVQTLRWVKSSAYNLDDVYAVPNLNGVSVSSQRINPGENLGKRERVTCTFFNHRHNDVDLDPYVLDRSYNPFEQGTYWGKFSAMYPNVQGYPARILRGNPDLDYSEFETSHYIADVGKVIGDNTGYSLVIKDVLDFAEGNKTLCPTPSQGLLSAAITSSTSSVTIEPVGIGAAYPTTFNASIGDESVSCTRSGDVVTFTQRGAFNSIAAAHDEGDTLQIMESFVSQNASQILERLLEYTNTPIEYYNVAAWDAQVTTVASPNLTAYIAEPTEVYKLIQDLMVDLALDIHTDVINKKIIMEFLINKLPDFEITDDNMDNPKSNFFEDKRVDLFFMSFGRRNPLEKMDQPKNYPTTIVRPSSNAVSLLNGNPAAIRRHYSRWIPSTLRAQASKTAQFIVGRYELAPRGLTCTMQASRSPSMAQIVTVRSSIFEDAYGRSPDITMQVVGVSRGQGNNQIELEEFRAAIIEPENTDIIISLTENLLNLGGLDTLRDIYDSVYSSLPAGSNVRFEADDGVVFGSTTTDFAVRVGEWPEIVSDGVTLQIVNLFIAGKGGIGGTNGGGAGGKAFYTRYDVELIDCTVGGGGGGGGGGGPPYYYGGNGAGYTRGSGATLTTGGTGFGNGGNLGSAGQTTAYAGGAAGVAIDGVSYCTLTTTTVYGSQIN